MCTLQENIVKLRGLDQNLKQELSKLTGVNRVQVSQMLLRVKMFLPTHTGFKNIFSPGPLETWVLKDDKCPAHSIFHFS